MKDRNTLRALFFILPWLIGFGATMVYPLLSALYYSFCDYSVLTPPVYVGVRNYGDLLTDHLFWLALGNSFFFAIVFLPLSIAVSLLLAMLLNLRIPAKGLLRTIFFLPTVVPMVCLAVIWQWMLKGEGGLVNTLLEPFFHLLNHLFGTQLSGPNWLLEPNTARVSLVFASLWTVGNTVLIYLAALQSVPTQLYECAELEGATSFQKYRYIALPSISPVIFYTVVSGLIGCLQTFAIPYVLAGGGEGPKNSLLFLSSYIFQNAFKYWNMGYACALSLVLFLLVLGCTILLLKLSAKSIYQAAD